MEAMLLAIICIVGVILGIGVGVLGRKVLLAKSEETAVRRASEIITTAEADSKKLLQDTSREVSDVRIEIEDEVRERRRDLVRQENRLENRESNLEKREQGIVDRSQSLDQKNEELDQAQVKIDQLEQQKLTELETLSGLSLEDARSMIMQKSADEARHELMKQYYDLAQEYKQESEENARRVLTMAIHRMAAGVVSEHSIKSVPLPSDDMKGRLIGREGRNIRAIEAATGVDLIIDDTPEAVTVSCFDPIRRQIAVVALSQLVKDGRIHPARIEETVKKAQEEVDEEIKKEGERAIFETGVRGLGPELIKLVGRLKYRYSYGENILQHSIEVSQLAGMLASEAKCNVEIAKAGGLLHDIGKALTHEIEGTHAEIGGDVARKYGIPHEVEIAIMEHHEEDKGSVEAFLVASADAISAARPGVRKDTLENYVKRMEELEAAASDFPGIEKVFAIQAGREVRVMVKPTEVDDISAANLARDVVKNIEEKLVYPGQIKVTIIRETRNSAIAK